MSTRDEFGMMGVMKFYLVIQIIAPLFLIGLTVWAINEPGLELSEAGPFILAGFAAWAVWQLTRLVKWSGFHVVVTDEDITVGGRTVRWDEVEQASVRHAVKFEPWIEIRPRSGEPLKIPAGIRKKSQLLTLVEKHHPDLVRP